MWFSVQCVILVWFKQKNRRLKVRFVFCDFPRRDVKCRSYIQAFMLHNIFICASNQNPTGLTIENVIFCWMSNFALIQGKNKRLNVRFVFRDFPRCDFKCGRYIQAFILHNIFICASNQNPPGLTIANVIFCWMDNSYLILAKIDNWRWDLCFVILWGAMSSVAGTFKLLSFITFLFVLHIKIHLDWP